MWGMMELTLASIRVGRHVASPHGNSSFPSGKRRSSTLHGAVKYQAMGGACLEKVISISGMTGSQREAGQGPFQRSVFCPGSGTQVMCFPKVNNTWTISSASLTSVFSSVKWEEPPILQLHLLRGKGSKGPVGVRTAGAKQTLA